MVRVVSQNFSPPRSRHSSGETDRDLAERADSALSSLGKKRYEIGFHDYESSSDSFWDSELDFEQVEDITANFGSPGDDINGNESPEKSDVQSKRKERRRERNKLSAQAYRKRKRQINDKKQQELFVLEERNKVLLAAVNRLEKKTEKARMCLRGISVPAPSNSNPLIGTDTDARKTSSKSTSPLTHHGNEEAGGELKHQVNLNINRNRVQQTSLTAMSTPPELHPKDEPTSDGAMASNASDASNLPNANVASLTPILINANDFGANVNARTNGFTARGQFRSLVAVKPKHGYYSSNLNYKTPIIRPSTLQTVPEIPSTCVGDLDDSMATSSTLNKISNPDSQHETGLGSCKEGKRSFESMKTFSNNINLNNSNYDYANDNFRKGDNHACDNHVQMNSVQHMNINGNLNQNTLSAAQEVYTRSHLMKDSHYVF